MAAMDALFCNGRPAGVPDLAAALTNYGHFTSLQVRAGAVQGLDLHLARLQQGSLELFGSALDLAQVRDWMAEALRATGRDDASLRVTVFSRQFDFRNPLREVALDVLVAVGSPVAIGPQPRGVRTARFRRDTPQIKHVGTFPLFQQRRAAMRDGFDDVLFVDTDGCISEGSTWNIVFHDGSQLVWPQAPALRGTAEALLRQGWGGPQRECPVMLDGLDRFGAAIACNASGLWPLASIDGQALAGSQALYEQARRVLDSVPWEPLAPA